MTIPDVFSLILVSLPVIVGCGSDATVPNTVNDQPTTSDAVQRADDVETYDTQFMLDRLRENISSSEWSIAPSPVTWSTFTADVGDAFSPDTPSIVWQKWTAVPTAITLKANTQIKNEIEAAVKDAKQGERPIERAFDFQGFRYVITASNGESDDTTFVRISFMDSRYAN